MSEIDSAVKPPIAARKPVERTHHGDVFVDDYEWLRDKTDDEVLAYLRAENAYTEARTAHLESLREAIFKEISDRTLQTDLSGPARRVLVLLAHDRGPAVHTALPGQGGRRPAAGDRRRDRGRGGDARRQR